MSERNSIERNQINLDIDRFTKESESRVDYNQMMSYPSIIANRWLSVRLEMLGAIIVFSACLFAVLARETISPAIVGLSISYALQISQVLSFLVRMTAEVETNIVAIERGLSFMNVEEANSFISNFLIH